MPRALKCGFSYKEFMHSTPSVIQMTLTAYGERKKEEIEFQEQIAWLNGRYVLQAIGAALNGKKCKYPENPAVEREKKRTDFTEEEKRKYSQMWLERLNTMKENYEMNHK